MQPKIGERERERERGRGRERESERESERVRDGYGLCVNSRISLCHFSDKRNNVYSHSSI